MNPESIEKTTPRLALTKTARATFIHRLNNDSKAIMSQEASTYINRNTHTNTHTVRGSIIYLTALKYSSN